jgi:dipeptidyl aminopeptidase/acylaminoacyl peptidase
MPSDPYWWRVGDGLDALAPDDPLVTIVESRGGFWQLVLLDVVNVTATPLGEDPNLYSMSRFSPDGRYVLLRAPDAWTLVDTTTGQQEQVGGSAENVEFLPDGKLLVESTANNLTRLDTVDPTRLQSRNLLADGIRYIFRAGSSTCDRAHFPERARWMLVDTQGRVFILDAARDDGISRTELSFTRSRPVIELLNQQFNTAQATLIQAGFLNKQNIEEEILEAVEQTGESLTDEELASRVRDEFTEKTFEIANQFGLAPIGSLSPDGTKLLFLRVQIIGSNIGDLLLSEPSSAAELLYSLYLVDLATGAEPRRLSIETKWRPSFAFSPDGSQILFESNLFEPDGDGSPTLYLANADGAGRHRIAEEDTLSVCWD